MTKLLARLFLRLSGWSHDSEAPKRNKYVLVAAPHTSNWDYIFMVAVARSLDMPLHWIGKHTLFRWPMKGLLLRTGGVPVDRSAPKGFVEQMADAFGAKEHMVLAIPAEGTRSRRDYWKSGFLRIAKAAEVPVVLGFLDYGRRHAGFGPELWPSQNPSDDMEIAREFYADKVGKFPEKFSPVRLRSEESTS